VEPVRIGCLVPFLALEALAQGGFDVVDLGTVLPGGSLGGLAPAEQALLGFGESLGGRRDRAEVGEHEMGGRAGGKGAKAADRKVPVEVGRRGRRS
jgi:hypothetical protein